MKNYKKYEKNNKNTKKYNSLINTFNKTMAKA